MLRSTLHLFIAFVSLVLSFVADGQIQVNNAVPYNNPQGLVENVLLGPGITASGFQFTQGTTIQFGYFNQGGNIIGLDSGIVLCSGEISLVMDLPNTDNQTAPPGGLGTPGDIDLDSIANIGSTFPVGTNDAAVLEFDFVPTGDSVQFRYVFASEEYPDYVCSINDAFGFFISGPGITGPYDGGVGGNAANIALIPGTNNPVTINTVNNGPLFPSATCPPSNAMYFVENYPGTSTLAFPYDGFTRILVATARVICGETYHIKLAVGDASDGIFDSAVFLEAGSFSSNQIVISPTTSYPNIGGDTVLYEGCGEMTLTFERFGDLSLEDTVFFQIGGTAANGFDYTELSDTVIFLADSSFMTSTISAALDNLDEGVESIILQVIEDQCSQTDTFTLELYIADPPNITLTSVDDTLDCTLPATPITVSVTGGIPGFTYIWSTGETTAVIAVSPIITTNYFVTVTDSCNLAMNMDTIQVRVPEDPVQMIALDTMLLCDAATLNLYVTLNNGIGAYEVWWSDGNLGDTNTVFINQNQSFTIWATDDCKQDTATENMNVFVPILNPITPELSSLKDTLDCLGEPKAIVVEANGGVGSYVFSWDNWVTTADSIILYPDSTILLPVAITDGCKNDTVTAIITITVPVYDSLLFTAVIDTFICPGDQTDIAVNVTGGAAQSGYTYEWSHLGDDAPLFSVNPLKTTTYTLLVRDACGWEYKNSMTINVDVPTANFDFEYQGDLSIIFTDLSSDDATFWLWDFNNGEQSQEQNLIYRYKNSSNHFVTLLVRNIHGCEDDISKEVKPPLALYLPSAFTPDDDDLNEVYQAQGIGIRKFHLLIFNRFGEVVYESQDINESWDGKDSGQGVYVYRVVAEGYNLEQYEKMGTITIIK